MKWLLLVFFGSSYSTSTVPGGFSAEFNDLKSCKSGYEQYVKNRPKDTYGQVSGVCVPKGGA